MTPSAGPDPVLPPDKLSLLVLSGDFERVQYALVVASAAAAIGTPVTLFFTNQALFSLAGEGPGGAGWRSLPGAAGRAGGAIDDERRARGVAGFEELLGACADLGVRFIACEMGLRAIGLDAAALRRDVPIEVAGVVTFIADASATGTMLTL